MIFYRFHFQNFKVIIIWSILIISLQFWQQIWLPHGLRFYLLYTVLDSILLVS